MPPPIAPADIMAMSCWIGNTSARDASGATPSRPTYQASATIIAVLAAASTILGSDSHRSVGPSGPSSRRCTRAWPREAVSGLVGLSNG